MSQAALVLIYSPAVALYSVGWGLLVTWVVQRFGFPHEGAIVFIPWMPRLRRKCAGCGKSSGTVVKIQSGQRMCGSCLYQLRACP